MGRKKRILIISEAHLIRNFVLTTINKIKGETGARFDCFITTKIDENTRTMLERDFENVFVNEYPRGPISRIPKFRLLQNIYGLRKLARKLPEYDIAHIQYYYFYYAFFTPIVRRKTRLFFITFFGSDFYRANKIAHFINRSSMLVFDRVFTITEVMLAHVASSYTLDTRHVETGTLVFMMDNFVSLPDFLKSNTQCSAKKAWHFEKGVIVCAYSAGALMQHSRIIDGLKKAEDKLKNFEIIFPMTYGWNAQQTRAMVKEQLRSCSFDSRVLEDFLPAETLQALRLAADIFIVIPSTDQLAASLLEHLAAGSVVITGKWLPYDDLVKKGIYFIAIDTPDDLAGVLSEVLDNLEDHKKRSKTNKDIILNMMSWDSIKKDWYKYFELEENYEWV